MSLLTFGAACAPADTESGSTTDDDDAVGAVDDGGTDEPEDDASTPMVCDEGEGIPCQCADGTAGTRTCQAGSFGRCGGCPEGNADTLCVPGVYVGQSVGTYSGGGAFMGLIPGWKVDTKDNLELTLTTTGGEFPVINSGCIAARQPDGSVDPNAGGLISGTVDCATGTIEGELRNYLTRNNGLTGAPERVYAKGTVKATYDPATSSFKGTWDQREPPDFFGMVASGGGTWSAALSKDDLPGGNTATGSTFKECWGFDFPDELFENAPP